MDDDAIEVIFPDDEPVEIKNGKLYFTGSCYETAELINALEFCSTKLETAWKRVDNYGLRYHYMAEPVPGGAIRIRGHFESRPAIGNFMVFCHEQRFSPAIVIDDCENIHLENINIYHCGGMGVIAQCSRDLYLDKVNIIRRPDSHRVISISADATHFVDCEGDIHIENCRMENQMDDPCNIHGIFRPVTGMIDPHTISVALIHAQQVGIDTIKPGDNVGFYQRKTFKLIHENKVESVRRINATHTELTFSDQLPVLDWSLVAVMKKCHDINVTIRGCTFRGNRARGLLISTLGKVLIENNYFHVPGSAIKISGDMNHWFESGPVEDVEIRHNFFDNCNYGVWGSALLDIDPEIEPADRIAPFHRNIRIHHNRIESFHRPLVYVRNTVEFNWADNTITQSKDYPTSGEKNPELVMDQAVTTRT